MPQRAPSSSSLMRPFVVLALPGMYLLYKYNQYRQQQMETARHRVTERELMHLNTKINSDIVLILENGYLNVDMPLEKRFEYQAPIIKRYADSIGAECPKAFIIVCASPIDCMVPLIAETLKETGWYDPRKLLGSLAVPEMRASTLAARALCLEPRYTRVPCVGGTEGESLVPLFSRAIEYFDFARHNAELMTETVRMAYQAVSRSEQSCKRVADLSEAHAVARLVSTVSHALLCHDIPRVTGYVETDAGQVISPARFIANEVEINGSGIVDNLGLPKMNDHEVTAVNLALNDLQDKLKMVLDWHCRYLGSTKRLDSCKFQFFTPKSYSSYLALDLLLNRHGICKKFDIPALSNCELELMDNAFIALQKNVALAKSWHGCAFERDIQQNQQMMRKNFLMPRPYDRVDDCQAYLAR